MQARSSKSNEREEGGWSGCIAKNFYRNFNLGIFTWQAITLSLQPFAVSIYLLYRVFKKSRTGRIFHKLCTLERNVLDKSCMA